MPSRDFDDKKKYTGKSRHKSPVRGPALSYVKWMGRAFRECLAASPEVSR